MSRVATEGSVSGSRLVTQNMLLGLERGWMMGRGTESKKERKRQRWMAMLSWHAYVIWEKSRGCWCPNELICQLMPFLPSLGLTKPLVTPEQLAATVSPLTTLRRVNSEDSVCMTMGRSLSRTWTQNRMRELYALESPKGMNRIETQKVGLVVPNLSP